MGRVIGISAPLRVAAVATGVSLVLGLGLAWLLVNRRFFGRREVGVLATALLAIPAPLLCGYFLLGRPAPGSWAMTCAAILSAAPALVCAGRKAFSGLDPVYGRAARSLGASEWRVLWRIELPLIWRPAAAAGALAFARVLAEFVAIMLIAPVISS